MKMSEVQTAIALLATFLNGRPADRYLDVLVNELTARQERIDELEKQLLARKHGDGQWHEVEQRNWEC